MRPSLNKYIVPVCDIKNKCIYLDEIIALSFEKCKEKIIEMYSEYSDSDDYNDFIKDLSDNGIIVGEIMDINELVISDKNYI